MCVISVVGEELCASKCVLCVLCIVCIKVVLERKQQRSKFIASKWLLPALSDPGTVSEYNKYKYI